MAEKESGGDGGKPRRLYDPVKGQPTWNKIGGDMDQGAYPDSPVRSSSPVAPTSTSKKAIQNPGKD